MNPLFRSYQEKNNPARNTLEGLVQSLMPQGMTLQQIVPNGMSAEQRVRQMIQNQEMTQDQFQELGQMASQLMQGLHF
jgi:replicative DNA helicase